VGFPLDKPSGQKESSHLSFPGDTITPIRHKITKLAASKTSRQN
jgi:hypothetical protein